MGRRRETDGDSDGFEINDKVEARFGGRSRWFKGKITRKNRDGTFDILYNDGDCERNVKKNLVRPLEDAKKKSSSKKRSAKLVLKKGVEVEARYRGRSKWIKGKITNVNRDYIGDNDDTYDIKYETGVTERKVKKDMIRGLDNDNNSDGSDDSDDDKKKKKSKGS